MPAYSGLWNGVYGTNYAMTAVPTPPITGMLRVLMQKRGLYGWVKAMNGHAPANFAQIAADEGSMQVRGGWDYDTRADDAANKVTITHTLGGKRTINTVPTLAAPTAGAMVQVLDTTLRNGYVADKANNGVTSKAWPAQVAT